METILSLRHQQGVRNVTAARPIRLRVLPLITMSEMGQTEKSRTITRRSVNRPKADMLGTKRFVAL